MALKKPPTRASVPSQDEMRNWPTRIEASKLIGKSVLTIIRMQKRGELNAQMVDKSWRYDPEELKQITEPGLDEMDPAQLVAAAGDAFTQVADHNHELHDRVIRVMEREHATHELLATENERLRGRIEKIEGRYIEMLDSFAEMMKETHEREMERVRVEASERRKERGFEMFLKLAPQALEHYQTSRVGNQLVDFVVGLDDTMFEAICQAEGFLPPDKVALLRQVRAQFKNKKENAHAHHPNERGDVPPVSPEQERLPEKH